MFNNGRANHHQESAELRRPLSHASMLIRPLARNARTWPGVRRRSTNRSRHGLR